jgi:hypothetical protein
MKRSDSAPATFAIVAVFIAACLFSIIESQAFTPKERAARRARIDAERAAAIAAPATTATTTTAATAATKSERFPTVMLDVSFILPSTETGMIITPANLPPLTVRGTPGQAMTVPVKVNLSPAGAYSVNLTSIPSGIQEIITIGQVTVR